jgi:hypothetical protein
VLMCGKYPAIFGEINSHHVYIGFCFVLGIIDGEAMRDVGQGMREMEEFRIH